MSMIHEITALSPKYKLPKRKGRGRSSGMGKTSGRGTKGSKARGGTYIRSGYEGGQTEIYKRLPKRGFSNFKFTKRYVVINVGDLNELADMKLIDAVSLRERGLIPGSDLPLKILGDGDIKVKVTVQAAWFSKSAVEKILAAGGTVLNLKGATFEFPKPKKKFIPREPAKKKKADDAPAAEAAPAT